MRLKLSDMRRPKLPFRLDRTTGEADGLIVGRTPERAQREDRIRLKALREAHLHCPALAAEAMDLHDRMARAIGAGEVPNTLPSAECWRVQCTPPVEHLSKEIEEFGPDRAALATFRPQGMVWEGDALLGVNPRVLKKTLRNHLDRAGVTRASGFLLAGLDLEFDANRGRTGVWDGHWHAIVGGDKIEALEALRERRAYKNIRVHPLERGMTVQPRVHILPGLANLPHPICYCLKGWACHRPTFKNDAGKLQRSKRKYRVPNPYLVHWLLWLDQWNLDDLVLRNGIKIGRNGFQIGSGK